MGVEVFALDQRACPVGDDYRGVGANVLECERLLTCRAYYGPVAIELADGRMIVELDRARDVA